MDVINLIMNAENLRTLVILVAIFAGFVWFDKRVDMKLDERFAAFHKLLKENDFAHINKTIEALTFMLQKNGILDPEDKKFIDSHLDDK